MNSALYKFVINHWLKPVAWVIFEHTRQINSGKGFLTSSASRKEICQPRLTAARSSKLLWKSVAEFQNPIAFFCRQCQNFFAKMSEFTGGMSRG